MYSFILGLYKYGMLAQQKGLENYKIIIENESLLDHSYRFNFIQQDIKFINNFKIIQGHPTVQGIKFCFLENHLSSEAKIKELVTDRLINFLDFDTNLVKEFLQFFNIREHLIMIYQTLGHVVSEPQRYVGPQIQDTLHKNQSR